MTDTDEPKSSYETPAETEQSVESETSGANRPDPKLLELLVCPLTKSSLVYDRKAGELISRAARLAYPIRDGIPIMLPSEARELDL